jgi:hypothetical protein
VRYRGGLDHPHAFQVDRLRTRMIEQSDTASEQNRRQVNLYFVKNSRLDALLRDAGGAYTDIPVSLPLPFQRRFRRRP